MTPAENTAPIPIAKPSASYNQDLRPTRNDASQLALVRHIAESLNDHVLNPSGLGEVLTAITTAFGASMALVLEVQDDGDLRVVTMNGDNPDHPLLGTHFSHEDSIVAQVFRAKTTQLLGQGRSSGACLNFGDHSQSFVQQFIAPMLQSDEFIGLLVIGSENAQALDERDAQLVTLIAGLFAPCIQQIRLKRTLDQTQESLRDQFMRAEKMRTMGEMASGVFHDFNNILGAVVGRVQLVHYKVEDEGLKRSLSQIERIALQGAETVKRLQEFSRLHQQQQAGPCDLNRVIEDALEVTRHRWESQAQKRGISYQIDKRFGQDVVVKGMHSQLVDAVANLVRNALDAMEQGGRLTFETTRSGGVSRLSVRDEGQGMTPEQVEHVFAPFFTTKGSEGTGLGMTVVQDIIRSHKGTISTESKPGVGTTFRIEIPVYKESAKGSRDSGDHKKVDTLNLLVVDDDHIILDVVTEALEDAGHKVDSYSHGSDAINALQSNDYSVVVTDLGMPDVTGWEVARAAKMHQPQIPVVVISGWGAQFNDDQLSDSGVDAMLAKPFHLQLLRETIERLARGETANVPTVRT